MSGLFNTISKKFRNSVQNELGTSSPAVRVQVGDGISRTPYQASTCYERRAGLDTFGGKSAFFRLTFLLAHGCGSCQSKRSVGGLLNCARIYGPLGLEPEPPDVRTNNQHSAPCDIEALKAIQVPMHEPWSELLTQSLVAVQRGPHTTPL